MRDVLTMAVASGLGCLQSRKLFGSLLSALLSVRRYVKLQALSRWFYTSFECSVMMATRWLLRDEVLPASRACSALGPPCCPLYNI